jgi:hypothetical protein
LVSGRVLVDGKPLERGVINFLPVNGTRGPGAGGAIENGEFFLDPHEGPIVGSNRVEIRGFRKTGKTMAEEVPAVSAEFNEKSTLVREIKDGNNELTFELPGTGHPKK